jgi:hypothetical protein
MAVSLSVVEFDGNEKDPCSLQGSGDVLGVRPSVEAHA